MSEPDSRKAEKVRGVALTVLAIGLGLALNSFVLALPPFRFGIWNQSEPVLVALHLLSGVEALVLAVLVGVDRRYGARIANPAVLIMGGLAIWTLVSGQFQDLPRFGWWGSPQIGEGLFLFLDIAILAAAGSVLSIHRRIRMAVVVSGLAGILALIAMNGYRFAFGTFGFAPYYFLDYQAFFAAFLFPLILVGVRSARRKWAVWALALVLTAVAVVISDNKSAYGLAFGVVPATMGVLYVLRRRWSERAWRWTAAGAAASLAIALTVGIMALDIEQIALREDLIGRLANSVESRTHLIDIVTSAVEKQPSIAIVGAGWGRFSDLLAANLPMDWVSTRDPGDMVKDSPEFRVWDAVLRVDFHSHNFLAEAMAGGGIPALSLVLLFVAGLPLWARRRYLGVAATVAIMTAGLSAFWFQLAVSFPWMAVAWGMLSGRGGRWSASPRISSTARAALPVVGMVLLFSGTDLFLLSNRAYFYLPAQTAAQQVTAGGRCPDALEDSGRGGIHVAHRLRFFVSFVANLANTDTARLTDKEIGYLRGLICASEQAIKDGAALRLKIAAVAARGDLAFAASHPKLAPVRAAYLRNWGERLSDVLDQAPERTDLAVPYLSWLLKQGRETEFAGLASRLYAANPEDPIALWFSGIALTASDATLREGGARMRRALERGLGRFMPVDEQMKRQLLQ